MKIICCCHYFNSRFSSTFLYLATCFWSKRKQMKKCSRKYSARLNTGLFQRCIQEPVKRQGWCLKVPYLVSDWVLNTPLCFTLSLSCEIWVWVYKSFFPLHYVKSVQIRSFFRFRIWTFFTQCLTVVQLLSNLTKKCSPSSMVFLWKDLSKQTPKSTCFW